MGVFSLNLLLDFFLDVIFVGEVGGERRIPGLFAKTYDTEWQSLVMASINTPRHISRQLILGSNNLSIWWLFANISCCVNMEGKVKSENVSWLYNERT